MNDSWTLLEQFQKSHLIALLSPRTAEECVLAYEILNPLGVVIEIALRTDAALDGMAALRDTHPDALFLAGTVITPAQAQASIDAGAAGIVSPDYFPEVVQTCVRSDVMCVPGGLSDVGKQLAQKADLYGSSLEHLRAFRPYQWIHKLFPAIAGDASNIANAQAWKTVYKDLTVIYTGGVTAARIRRIMRQDKQAIICASALTRQMPDRQAMEAEVRYWHMMTGPLPNFRAPLPEKPARRAPLSDQPARLVTFGELMLRLSPPTGLRFTQTSALQSTFGGSEANVAVSLARWGLDSRFVTALPAHDIGQAAVDSLRTHGVDTNHILRTGDRVGVYYLEPGASQRPSKVIYDRAASSFSRIGPGQIVWTEVLDGATWFHVSGITPALSPSTAAVTSEAIRAAHEAGVTISIDINYRAKLWSKEEACSVLTPLMQYVDVLIGNEEDAANVFGIRAEGSDIAAGRLDAEAYASVARQLVERFNLDLAAITLRESRSASENAWSACLHDGKHSYQSKRYDIHVIDRVGAGDAFSAGLIFALLSARPPRDALEFAVAASCLKQTILGDFNLVTTSEVEALAAGDASGRIKR